MKKCLLFFVLLGLSFITNSQTRLYNQQTASANINSFNVISKGKEVAVLYAIGDSATVKIGTGTSDSGLVMAGTYTDYTWKKIAGRAFIDGKQVGNQKDPFFGRTSDRLCVLDGKLSFESGDDSTWTHPQSAISVYKPITENIVNTILFNSLTENKFYFRFIVKNEWSENHPQKGRVSGIDWMIVDFTVKMSLSDATNVVAGMKRTGAYGKDYTNVISAALLDTGYFRAFKINGRVYDNLDNRYVISTNSLFIQ